ncbi:MAG: PAS domain-containing protein, partial [Gemmatimonadota bacterium]
MNGWSSQQTTPLTTTRVLYWIYAGRLVVSLAIYGTAIIVGDLWRAAGAEPDSGFRTIAIFGLATAAFATPAAYWYSHIHGGKPRRPFLLSQALLDLLIVTGIVHITGGSQSFFPPLLYIALVSGYALILPFAYTLGLTLLVGATYLLDLIVAYPAQLGGTVLFQIAVFAIVATVAGMIAGRLRQVGQELRTLEGELRRLRLGTADVLRTLSSGVVTLDESGQVAYMNPAAAELLGLDSDMWLGRDLLPELNRRAPEISRAVRETIRKRAVVRNREALVDGAQSASRRDRLPLGTAPSRSDVGGSTSVAGSPSAEVPVSVSTALHSPPDAPPSVTLVLQDMRVVRQLENLRLRTGRLEAVAELSASLAHEIRNPMASIRSSAEQLARRAGDDED